MPRPKQSAALSYDERRARIKAYEQMCDGLRTRMASCVADDTLALDIADLESWVSIMKGACETNLGHQRKNHALSKRT